MGMEMAFGWFGLMGFIYVSLVIYLLVLATRFVGAVERFVKKYNPR